MGAWEGDARAAASLTGSSVFDGTHLNLSFAIELLLELSEAGVRIRVLQGVFFLQYTVWDPSALLASLCKYRYGLTRCLVLALAS